MKLFLVQHGNAVDKQVDPDRPLSKEGQRDVLHMAAFLTQAAIQVHHVVHSGKTRAEQTANILTDKISPSVEIEVVSAISPNDDVTAFAGTLSNWDKDTLIVGHLPFMAKLVALLVTGDANMEIVEFLPGSVICLESTGENKWRINYMLRPDVLLVLPE